MLEKHKNYVNCANTQVMLYSKSNADNFDFSSLENSNGEAILKSTIPIEKLIIEKLKENPDPTLVKALSEKMYCYLISVLDIITSENKNNFSNKVKNIFKTGKFFSEKKFSCFRTRIYYTGNFFRKFPILRVEYDRYGFFSYVGNHEIQFIINDNRVSEILTENFKLKVSATDLFKCDIEIADERKSRKSIERINYQNRWIMLKNI